MLLNHDPAVDCRDDLGRTPLHLAAASGHKQCVKALLMNGATCHVRDNQTKLVGRPISEDDDRFKAVESRWTVIWSVRLMRTDCFHLVCYSLFHKSLFISLLLPSSDGRRSTQLPHPVTWNVCVFSSTLRLKPPLTRIPPPLLPPLRLLRDTTTTMTKTTLKNEARVDPQRAPTWNPSR